MFLASSYFERIPYVHISSGIWAIKRKKIASGPLPKNIEKQKKLIRGFGYDVDHASVFAPYCDAMLTEKIMCNYLGEWNDQSQSLYRFSAYSIESEADFLDYLAKVEDSLSKEMKEELEIAYGEPT